MACSYLSMLKVVYLHIGVPRTGSTSIQRALFKSAEALRSYGADYPSIGLQKGAHVNLTLEMGRPHAKLRFDEAMGTWADIRKHAERSAYRKFIVSCEAFASFNDEQVADVSRRLSGVETKIVFFVRNQVNAIQSAYRHMLIRREVTPDHAINKMVTMRHYDYRLLYDRWASHFGGFAMRPIIYERCQSGALKDLLAVVDKRIDASRFPILTENLSKNSTPPFALEQVHQIHEAFDQSNRQFEEIVGRLPRSYFRDEPPHWAEAISRPWTRFLAR